MIDLHSHLLPRIDDGAESGAAVVALAKAWLEAGVNRVVATPHVNLKYRNTADSIRESYLHVRDLLSPDLPDLQVEMGAEISASVANEIPDSELEQLTLGDSKWLLIEPPSSSTAFGLHAMIFEIQGRGWNVLLAHPERNPVLQQDLDLLASMVSGGIKTQATAGAFIGRYGRTSERMARKMMNMGLVHTVASDAHHATLRPPEMSEPLVKAGYGHMVNYLCSDMPAWILDGGLEPKRPAVNKTPRKNTFRRFKRFL